MKTNYTHLLLLSLTKLLLLLSFNFISCKEKNIPFEKQTIIFREYLLTTFKINLSTETTYFFVIPSSSCSGCISRLLSSVNRRTSSNSYVIISFNQKEKLSDLVVNERILVDKENRIDNLNLMTLNTSLITWEKDKIINIETVIPENIEEVFKKLKMN